MLDTVSAFDSNLGTKEREVAEKKLRDFVTEFLKHLIDRDGQNSSLGIFCRVDVSVFIDKDNKATFFVNEVERGMTTSLFSSNGTGMVGQVGSDLSWPLASWITEEKKRLGIS